MFHLDHDKFYELILVVPHMMFSPCASGTTWCLIGATSSKVKLLHGVSTKKRYFNGFIWNLSSFIVDLLTFRFLAWG